MAMILLFVAIVGIASGMGVLLRIIFCALSSNPPDSKFRNENRT
jgi:hypothetical protein